MNRLSFLFLTFFSLCLLVSCGQKGPLYLPKAPQEEIK